MGGKSDKKTETKNILRSLRSNKFFLKKNRIMSCVDRKKVRRRSLEEPHGEESSTLENSQKNVEDCGM